jgi:predicted AAA+ superfamily ATPase
VDAGTVNTHIEILEESHVIKKILPFAGGKRREITSAPKVFFIDNGIRNQLLSNFSTDLQLRVDRGPLFENWAFSEICKMLPFQDSVKFWRSKSRAEVDFVIEHAGKVYGLEVKSAFVKHPEVSRSARSFVQAYTPDGFAVLNMGLERSLDHEKGKVDFVTPHSLGSWLGARLGGQG